MRYLFFVLSMICSFYTYADMAAKDVYERHCIVCHRDGVAGAPKFRDKAAWAPRLANRKKEDLVATVNKGKNAMPPKGTCQECTDSDIKAAIDYMVPQ
jgi:cytochrome c5